MGYSRRPFFILLLVSFSLVRINPAGGEEGQSVRYEIVQLGNGLLLRGAEVDAPETPQEILPVQPFESLISEVPYRGGGPRSPAVARRTAALHIAEEGLAFLRNQRPEKALSRLETSMSLEAIPYTYYYLALAHARLGHYRHSLAFLDVAENWLGRDPAWAAEISHLRNSTRQAMELARQKDLAQSGLEPTTQAENPGAAADRPTEPEPPLIPPALLFPFLFFFFWIARSWNRQTTLRALRSEVRATGRTMARQLETAIHKRHLRENKWSV